MKMIVIDPGHGGTNDSGIYALGASGNGLRKADFLCGMQLQWVLAGEPVE